MIRRHDPEALSDGLGIYEWPSTIEDPQALRDNRYFAFKADWDARTDHVDFDQAERLMDRTSTDTDEEGVPARNSIRRIVEDLLSVVLPNMPTAELRHMKPIPENLPPEERRVLLKVYEETAKNRNDAVRYIENRSDYQNQRVRIVYDAIVNGVGYAHPRAGEMPSIRTHPEAIPLAHKQEWSLSDWETYMRLANEPRTGHVESNEVVWRAGVRSIFDEEMLRVSRHRVADVHWLRDYYSEPDIDPGEGDLFLQSHSREDVGDRAGFVETWQIEPYVKEARETFFMMGGDAATRQVSRPLMDALMVYTVITTNKLLDRQVLTSDEVVMELPFVPYYVKISKEHPYGFSVPLMLELSQKFANRMRAIMVKQGMNSVSPGILAVLLSAVTDYDVDELERVAREGGLAKLELNDLQDISSAIQSFPNTNQGVNNALAQITAAEERAMEQEGQAADPAMLARSRSASGKQALLAATDRPKGFSILLLAASEENHKVRLDKENQQAFKEGDEMPLGDGDRSAIVNQRERVRVNLTDYRGLPMRDTLFQTPTNPNGRPRYDIEVVRNDMSLPMRAVANTRGNWPTDMFSRLNIAEAMAQGIVRLHPETARDIVLDERTKQRDDANWAETEAEQAVQQQMAELLQTAQQGGDPQEALQQMPQAQTGQRRTTPQDEQMRFQGAEPPQ